MLTLDDNTEIWNIMVLPMSEKLAGSPMTFFLSLMTKVGVMSIPIQLAKPYDVATSCSPCSAHELIPCQHRENKTHTCTITLTTD